MGGSNPIRIQSMTNTATQDTEASVAQAKRIVDAGGEYVRLTAQGIKEAENLMNINIGLRQDGYMVPLVADIHFNPKVADVAAQYVEKVRINPGNYVDAARTFKHLEYTDEEYAQELQKIHDRFVPFLNICKENHTAIRIGVNHGSLSDRIMSRYGDTPEGMVESCMEFLRICVQENFTDVVISIKASNTVVMVKTVRLLAAVMEQEGMRFPLHLGVTEAGDGEDGRIKSALGIGALLADGLGDTIRVSLTADPVEEVYAARDILKAAGIRREGAELVSCPTCGRTQIDLIGLADHRQRFSVSAQLKGVAGAPRLTVAVTARKLRTVDRKIAGIAHKGRSFHLLEDVERPVGQELDVDIEIRICLVAPLRLAPLAHNARINVFRTVVILRTTG